MGGGKKSKKKKTKTKAQQAAAKRHAKFKQTRVQTFGGKKTSFSKSEQKRITNAGYSVKGYSSAAPKSNTAVQVAKDNAKYGNTVPSGSFGISAAGKAQAEANKAEAAAKRTVPAGSFNISAAGRAQAEANKAAAAAKAQAEAKSAAESRRLAAENARRIASERAAAKAEADRVAAAKKAAEKAAAERARVKAAEEKRQRQFDPNRLSSTFSTSFTQNPLTSNNYFNLGKDVRVPNESTASFGKLFADDRAQITRTDKAFKEGATGIKGANPLKAFTPKMLQTGPTGLVREAATRFLPAGIRNLSLGAEVFNQGRSDSALTQSLNNVGNTNVGGLSIGFKSPESTDIGARTGRFLSDTFDKVAGGLNIGGAAQASEGEGEGSATGRTIGQNIKDAAKFTGNLLQQPKAALAYGVDVANQLFSPRLADGTLTGNTDFAGRTPGAEGFDNRDVKLKSAVNNAMDSRFVQQAGENLGLPSNFKAQTKDAMTALGENYRGATADRDGIYKGTSETLKNLTSDERLAPVAKFLNQLSTDNENVADADRDEKFSLMGFQTPFTNEQAADAITAFQPNAEPMTGFNKAERGLIEGGGGNRILSGKLTDAAREAITGSIGTGESLGLDKGSPLSISNMLDAGKLIAQNQKTEGTLANQRISEIGRLANRAGQITTPSIIRGIVPRFGGTPRSSGQPTPLQGTGTTGGSTQAAPMEELPIYQTAPTTTTPTQTGTDTSNLQQIQQQSYIQNLARLGITDLRMMPQFRANRRAPKRFRSFRRGYF